MSYRMMTRETVEGILMAEGTADEIAARFEVSASAVSRTKRLGTKKAQRVHDSLVRQGREPLVWNAVARYDFTPQQIAEIRAGREPSSQVAARYGCSSALIRMIRTGRAYL